MSTAGAIHTEFRSLSVCLLVDDLPPPGLPGEPALITVSRMVQCIALHTIDMTSGDSVTRRRVKIMTGEDNVSMRVAHVSIAVPETSPSPWNLPRHSQVSLSIASGKRNV